MRMRDQANTNLRVHAVTSTAADKIINHSSNPPSTPTIALSIGSALKDLKYNDEKTRDEDLALLDAEIEKLDSK